MRRLTIFGMLLLAVSVDCSVWTKIDLWGLNLSLTLCVVVNLSVVYGKFSGALAGMAAGLIMDGLVSPAPGFYAVANMLTGYAAGAVFSRGMREDPLLIGMLCVGMYLLREGITIILALMIGVHPESLLYLLVRYLLPSALLNAAAGVPLYLLMRGFLSRGYMRRKKLGYD